MFVGRHVCIDLDKQECLSDCLCVCIRHEQVFMHLILYMAYMGHLMGVFLYSTYIVIGIEINIVACCFFIEMCSNVGIYVH